MIIYQNLRENFFNYISESKTLNKIDKIANKKAIFVLATVGVAGAVALFCTGFTAFAITGVAVTGTVVAASLLFKKMMQSAKNAENINPEQNLESDIQNIVQTSFSTNTSFNESLDDAIASFRDLLDKEKINEPQKLIDLFFNKLNALKDNNEDSNTIDNFIAKYKKNI